MEPLARRSRKRSFHGDEAGVLQEAQGLRPVVLHCRFHHRIHNLGGFYRLDCGYLLLSVFRSFRRIPIPWLLLMVRYPGNHEFPDHEKNGLDLDFLLLMSCSFIHEFPFFKINSKMGTVLQDIYSAEKNSSQINNFFAF